MEKELLDAIRASFGLAGVIVAFTAVLLYGTLAQLAKMRSEFQQSAARDLLNARFKAYGELWHQLAPLALYSNELFNARAAETLSERLSSWYFSPEGGLYLTARARDFYFGLQELLRAAQTLPGWELTERPNEPKTLFRDALRQVAPAITDAHLTAPRSIDGAAWLAACAALAQAMSGWNDRHDEQRAARVFACLQQASSVLRTVLADELDSRLEVHAPRPWWRRWRH